MGTKNKEHPQIERKERLERPQTLSPGAGDRDQESNPQSKAGKIVRGRDIPEDIYKRLLRNTIQEHLLLITDEITDVGVPSLTAVAETSASFHLC